MRRLLPLLAAALATSGLGLAGGAFVSASDSRPEPGTTQARATFAGGCFWSMEPPFDAVPGVVSTTAGYAGGTVARPRYEQVAAGLTGHAEVVQVVFDPGRVSYETLLEVFWRNVDPLDAGGQFCDRGSPYRSAIFVEGEEQARQALASRERFQRSGRLRAPIVTGVVPLKAFYPAEAYHQDYARRNVRQYWTYSHGCGRGRRLAELWGESGH